MGFFLHWLHVGLFRSGKFARRIASIYELLHTAWGFPSPDPSLFPPNGSKPERPSLRLILSGVRQWSLVLEHLAEITAVDPTIAGRAPDEMLGLVLRRIAHTFA